MTVRIGAGCVLMLVCTCDEKQSDVEERQEVVRKSRQTGSAGARRLPRESERFELRRWEVPADFVTRLGREVRGGVQSGVGSADAKLYFGTAREFFVEYGIEFPRGSRIDLLPERGQLRVRSSAECLDLVDDVIATMQPMEMFVLDQKLFRRMQPRFTEQERAQRGETEAIERKLKEIVIPEVDFDETTFGEAVAWLEGQARELDQSEGRKGVRIQILDPGEPDEELADGTLVASSIGDARIRELKLRNVPIVTVLQYMTDSSRIRYMVDHEGVTILARGFGVTEFFTQPVEARWRVDSAVIDRLVQLPGIGEAGAERAEPFGSERVSNDEPPRVPLVDALKDSGIEFPPGAMAQYDAETATLVMVNNSRARELTDILLETLAIEISRERALGRRE